MNTNIFVYVFNLFIVYLASNHPRVKCQYRINLTPTAHSLFRMGVNDDLNALTHALTQWLVKRAHLNYQSLRLQWQPSLLLVLLFLSHNIYLEMMSWVCRNIKKSLWKTDEYHELWRKSLSQIGKRTHYYYRTSLYSPLIEFPPYFCQKIFLKIFSGSRCFFCSSHWFTRG